MFCNHGNRWAQEEALNINHCGSSMGLEPQHWPATWLAAHRLGT